MKKICGVGVDRGYTDRQSGGVWWQWWSVDRGYTDRQSGGVWWPWWIVDT